MTVSNPQQIGTVGGTPIIAELGPGVAPAALMSVTLSAGYTRTPPPGYPSDTPPGRAAASDLPPVIASGTTITVPQAEGAALVAAGAATEVGLVPAGQVGGALSVIGN